MADYKQSLEIYGSSFSTNPSSTSLWHLVNGLLLNLLRLICSLLQRCSLLLGFHSLGLVFGSFDRLISLSLPNLGFHVTFRHNGFKGGSLDGTLEFHRSPGSLLRDFFLGSLLVLLSVENGP